MNVSVSLMGLNGNIIFNHFNYLTFSTITTLT